jgi:membrane fusion protein, macrolide-specific efflux system
MKSFLSILNKIKSFTTSGKKRKLITLLVVILLGFFGWKSFNGQKLTVAYQSEKAAKGTLVISLAESGQVAVSNKVSIVTQASGIVSKIYVNSGDEVKSGDKIAEVTLDTAGQQRQAQAYSSLLSAQNNLKNAQAQLYTLQNQLFVANQKFVNDRGINNPSTDQKNDPVYIEENATWLAAEAAYKNQAGTIAQSQANLNNANLAYQLTSGTVVAPTDGVVSDVTIAEGMQIGSSNTTSSSSTSASNQQIAAIKTGNAAAITVNVEEASAAQVKVGQKATVTFDAISDKTFTGVVRGINTTGVTSSSVTTYPTIIQLDDIGDANILPNMNASVIIISKVKTDVLLIPSSAIQATGSQSTVMVLKNGKATSVTVETGDSSDSQTEITSGLSEGDEVITNYISASDPSQSNTTSSFSSTSRTSGSRSGGAVMMGPGM